MGWQDSIAALLAQRDNEQYQGPGLRRPRPLQQPSRYPGQQNAPALPMGSRGRQNAVIPARNEAPGPIPGTLAPSWNAAPPQPVRDESGAPVQHWVQTPDGRWVLQSRPAEQGALRTRPGNTSPRGYADFASWANQYTAAAQPDVGGQEADYGHTGFAPADAPGVVAPRPNGMFYQGPDEDLNRLRMQEDEAYRAAVERARNRLQPPRRGGR